MFAKAAERQLVLACKALQKFWIHDVALQDVLKAASEAAPDEACSTGPHKVMQSISLGQQHKLL